MRAYVARLERQQPPAYRNGSGASVFVRVDVSADLTRAWEWLYH
jgi:hypothetical protein